MGYKVLSVMDNMRDNYGPRKGLEGPFLFAGHRVLYYCPVEGKYYDPRSDWFLSHEEMDEVNKQLTAMLSS